MKGEKRFSCLMLIGAVLLLVGTFNIVPLNELTISSPGGYPVFIGLLAVALAALIVFGKHEETDEKVFQPVIVAFIVMLVLYVLGIIYFHYTAATLLFLFAGIFYLNRKNWKRALLIAYISTFMILLIFKYLFKVIMP